MSPTSLQFFSIYFLKFISCFLIFFSKFVFSELLLDLRQKIGPHYYCRSDIKFDPVKRTAIEDRLSTVRPSHLGGKLVSHVDNRDGFRYELQEGYWAMVRFSGTEPILRIYAVADSLELSKQLLDDVATLIEL